MLEEAADKLHDIKCHGAPTVAVVYFVFEEDLSVFDLYNAGVGDSDLEDIGCKIMDGMRACADGLGVDDPGLVPDLFGDEGSEIVLDHLMPELGLEDF